MSRYGTIIDPSTAVVTFIESADPQDLAARINAFLLATLQAAQDEVLVTDITLSGAGDGHTFVALIEYTGEDNADGGIPLTDAAGEGTASIRVACYLAADDQELAVARTAAVVPVTDEQLVDEQLVGASQGTRFMGMAVLSFESGIMSLAAYALFGSDAGTAIPVVIGGTGSLTPVLDTDLALQESQNFASPGAGRLQYVGATAMDVNLHLSVSLVIDTAEAANHAGRLAIVRDPSGTPAAIGLMTAMSVEQNTPANAHLQNFVVESLTTLEPNDEIGIALIDDTAASTMTILSAQLLVTPR